MTLLLIMKILLVYAISEEKIEVNIPNAEVIYVETGIGKVNAAMKTMHAICEYHPDMVINMGSAGTLNHKVGDIIVCNRFIDRDLRNVHLDGVISEMEFDVEVIKKAIPSWQLVEHAKLIGSCNTGDSFLTEGTDVEGDVIDMEAFAVADVCREMKIPFISVKYVTDVVGQNSSQEWFAKLKDAREGLSKFFIDSVK